MAHLNHASFLLAAFGLYLAVFLPMAEAASCPANRINASDICGDVERLSVKTAPNLTHVVCDNLQNLIRFNSTFILRALEHVLRGRASVPVDIARVLFQQVDGKALETALEQFNHKIMNSSVISDPWKTVMLRALWDEKIRNEDGFNETEFVESWFQKRLRLLLSVIPTDMLQCLQNETMGCAQYQAIVKGLDAEFMKMDHQIQEEVFDSFQLPYLNRLKSNGSACLENLNSISWLNANLGRFSQYAKYRDLVSLNSKFDGLDALQNLTVKQLAQLSATRGALRTSRDVEDLMEFIGNSTLMEYIDEFSRQANVSLSKDILGSLLEHILGAAQSILQNADDAEFVVWMEQRLAPLIPGMNSTSVPILFSHLETRSCSAVHNVSILLNGSIGEFSNATRQRIYEAILHVISNSSRTCYTSNSSFSVFLEETFQGFADFLTLKDLEKLISTPGLQKIVNTIPPGVLADLFSRQGFLNSDEFLTAVLRNYKRNDAFIDRFNQKDIIDRLPNGTKAALLTGVWPTVVSNNNATEVTTWLEHRLAPYLMFLSGKMLNTTESLNASCATFRKLVSHLNENISMFKEREEELYYSIKGYLSATTAKPRCYNNSDPETSDWLVTYLGRYISYSRARDMRLLTNHSTAVFQDLVLNPDNLELINKTKIHKDLAEMYANALFAADSDFSLDGLPDQLICFARHSTLISTLSPHEVLGLVAQVNLYCSSSYPSASDRQLATMLVAQIKTFDGPSLVALGQQAMGLTAGQISDLSAQDLVDPKVLQSLGQVNGWNRGQSQGLINKILRSNFTLNTAEKFERLGTLAQGLLSNSFDDISADMAIGLAKKASFVSALKQGPEYLKKAFVSKILSNSSSLSDILDNVPDDLAEQVPNSLLVFGGKTPDLQKINAKRWSSQQAAVLFGDVLSSTKNFTEFSAFVLQGFQCNAASKLTPGQLSFLAQEVKIKNASLRDDQLSCMAKLLSRSNLTANFTHYPPDVLLFFPLDKVEHQNCESFYALAAQGNLTLLVNGSTQRTKLLENALRCFGVVNTSLTKEKLQTLGAFVCDMDAASIKDSDPGIVENLKRCPDLTESQRISLNVLLSSGKTSYGIPASWDDGTLEALGPLAFYINHTTWDFINKEERKIFFGNVADAFDSQTSSQKKKTIHFFRTIGSKPSSSLRTKRAPEDCQSSPITTSILEDPLFIIHYDTVQQFEACLSNEVLKANLVPLLEQPLPNNYLTVIKRKLNEIYPNGVPEDQLKLMGFLLRQYSADEIGKWNVTSSDTLATLLNRDNGAWEVDQLRRLVARYMELGGTLTGPLLDILEGKYLCFLDEDQLKQINPESIRHAEKLDISSCSQGKKDILYEKAHTAFANQDGSSAYYPLIQPYLGGAPAKDLKKLAGSRVAMDINTFINLKPEELQKLSVRDVRGLLGVNLPDLKGVENNPPIALWIKSHFQSELDTLRIGLRGGMTSLSSTAASSSVAGIFMASNPTDASTVDIRAIPITESPISFASDATIFRDVSAKSSTTAFMGLDRESHSAAPEFHSTPLFNPTLVASEATYMSTNLIGTHLPALAEDPTIEFSTEIPGTSSEILAVSPDVTTLADKPISGTPASTFAEDIDTTTPHEIIMDFNNITATSSVLSTVPTEPTSVAPTEAITTFSNFTVTSDDATSLGFGTTKEADIDMTTSLKFSETSSNTRITGLLALTTDTQIATSPTPPISTNPPISANTSASNASSAMIGMTATSSGSPLTPSEHLPNVTASAPLTSATGMKDKATTALRKTTTQDPEMSHRPSVPPGLVSSHSTVTPASTERNTTRSTRKTKPPSYPTPNGYINVQPLRDSSVKPAASCLLLTLHLLVGITVQRSLL